MNEVTQQSGRFMPHKIVSMQAKTRGDVDFDDGGRPIRGLFQNNGYYLVEDESMTDAPQMTEPTLGDMMRTMKRKSLVLTAHACANKAMRELADAQERAEYAMNLVRRLESDQ